MKSSITELRIHMIKLLPLVALDWLFAFPGMMPALNIWFSRSTSSSVEAFATASRMALASSAEAPPEKSRALVLRLGSSAILAYQEAEDFHPLMFYF